MRRFHTHIVLDIAVKFSARIGGLVDSKRVRHKDIGVDAVACRPIALQRKTQLQFELIAIMNGDTPQKSTFQYDSSLSYQSPVSTGNR